MSSLYYVLPAAITFVIALFAFLRDPAASKVSVLNWLFIVLVGVLWPMTLPFIVWKKLLSLVHPVKSLNHATNEIVEFEFRRSHSI